MWKVFFQLLKIITLHNQEFKIANIFSSIEIINYVINLLTYTTLCCCQLDLLFEKKSLATLTKGQELLQIFQLTRYCRRGHNL